MPALQPLLVTVDETTSYDFEPLGVQNALASYQGTKNTLSMDGNGVPVSVPVNLSPVLQPTMTISLKKPTKTSRLSQARLKVSIPKPVIVDGVITQAKSHENFVDVLFVTSEKAVEAERYELINILINTLSTGTAMQVVGANKAIY